MKLADIIDTFITGDWGEESPTQDTPNAAYCVRGADIVPITNHNFTDIPQRYVCDRTKETKLLAAGDLVIEKSGGSPTQSTGRIVYVSEDLIKAKGNVVCSNFCTAFRVKAGWNPLYVYYFWQNVYNHGAFFNFEGKTSGIKNLQLDNALSAIDIEYLPLEKQNQIVASLASIDEKIKVNRQINDNLEAMAKQLYDYWFVQFDFPNEEGKPYKSNGGAMVWNEKLKREIPQRWSDCVLGDYIGRITNGLNPRKNFVLGSGNNYYVTIRSLVGTTIDWNNCDRCDDEALSKINSRSQLQIGDIIFSAIGTIGRTYYILEEPTNWNISETSFTLRAKENVPNDFFYGMLRSNEIQIKADKAAMGSTLRCLVMDSLCSLQYIEIPNYMMKLFAAKVSPLYRQIHRNNKEIAELTKQRDKLLPLLMNGQAMVNYHLSASFLSSLILYRDQYKFYDMKETIIQAVLDGMRAVLTENQLDLLTDVTRKALSECEITPKATEEEQRNKENVELLGAFISSKKVEGCSDKTIHYYKSSIEKLIATVKKNVCDISTNDIRCYLAEQQEQRVLSKVTIDNLRRIYSSFFSWLEDEDYITKSPVRRIHKVRTDALVKEVLTDENIEVLRDSCQELRDIAMIDLLLSTGIRVGELVKINREDIDFQERQCVVFGKGNKEREVYFNARTKIHLKKYLEQRTDTNPALFVSLHEPHTRLTISGVEVRLRQLGKRVNLNKVHPHKFRRTLATMAIDKGMPIEQVQKMLGHVKIDTTLHYAMVNQTNVKIAHRKFLN